MIYILETGCECFKREANKVTHNLNKYAIHASARFCYVHRGSRDKTKRQSDKYATLTPTKILSKK